MKPCATANHKVYIAGRGYVNLKDLKPSDVIINETNGRTNRIKVSDIKIIGGSFMKCACGNDLASTESVYRTYITKDEDKYPDSHVLGHYEENGDFEPDGSPDYPLEHHDLVDGSDTCAACGTHVG